MDVIVSELIYYVLFNHVSYDVSLLISVHCWHYRVNLCNISGRELEDEINFSLDRIKDNLSAFSYSTLYYRSLVLTKASNAGLIDFSKRWLDEYGLIENALFTEPNDQALWFYLRWLLLTNFGKCLTLDEQRHNETSLVKIVFNRETKSLVFYLNRVVKVFPFEKIALLADSNKTVSISRDRLCTVKHRSSKLWYTQLDYVNSLDEVCLDGESKLKLVGLDGQQRWVNDEHVESAANLQMRIHNEQLESLLTLRQLEPDNKWLNLILSYFENADQQQILDDLVRLDPLRTNYYEDQKSKIRLEKLIANLDVDQSSVDLSRQQITVLYTPEPFAHLTALDLTGNRIRCLSTNLNCLVSLESLIVDHNLIDKIQRNFTLPNLKTISLRNNSKLDNVHSL